MNIKVLDKNEKVKIEDLRDFAKDWYDILLKGTVDIELGRVALGGEWHIDSCEILTSSGSSKDNIWGFNILFDGGDKQLEYHSLINIKPNKGHRNMEISDQELISKINDVLNSFIEF